jgi:hypothetical protein
LPFPYYTRLSARKQAVYRQSDAIVEVRLPHPLLFQDIVGLLRTALERDQRAAVEAAAQALVRGMMEMLHVPAVAVSVRAVRPSSHWGELHGLYTLRPPRALAASGVVPATRAPAAPAATIEVWMRTARHRRVVAFRTFLRTLLHEVCHHLDYHYLKLSDSLHTEGFFKRENSLFRQLVPAEPEPPRRAARRAPGRPGDAGA